jgi:ABC-2 type transport system permease protein
VIIEIGTGTGEFAIEVSKYCKKVIALDVSRTMLDFANEKAKMQQRSNIEFIHGGFLTYTHQGELVDAVITQFGSMFAVILSSSMLAKEEDEKTIEFLLAKPVTRNHVVTSKLLAFVGYLLAFNAGVGIVTLIGFELFAEEYSRMELLRLIVAPFLAHLSFASVGFLLSLFFTRRKSAYSVGIGLVLLVYFLNIMAALTEKVQFLRYVSPFYYMDAADIIVDGRINPLHMLILLVVSALAIGATYLLYNRRDITI